MNINTKLKDWVPTWKDIKLTPKERLFVYYYFVCIGIYIILDRPYMLRAVPHLVPIIP